MARLTGDIMFILDIQQANRVITNMMMGEIDDVDRVGLLCMTSKVVTWSGLVGFFFYWEGHLPP